MNTTPDRHESVWTVTGATKGDGVEEKHCVWNSFQNRRPQVSAVIPRRTRIEAISCLIRALPRRPGQDLSQNTQSTVIRNKTITPYTRNALLARAQNMTIEGNKVDCSLGGVIGLNLSYASGQDDARLGNVRVAGNTFVCPSNVGLVALRPYRDEDGVPDTRDIKIIDNVFHVGSALAIRISGVQTLTSRGNTFKQNGIPVKDASRFTVFSKCVDAMVEQ